MYVWSELCGFQIIKRQSSHHIETSQLTFGSKQLTGSMWLQLIESCLDLKRENGTLAEV